MILDTCDGAGHEQRLFIEDRSRLVRQRNLVHDTRAGGAKPIAREHWSISSEE